MVYCNYPVLKITSTFEMDFSTSPRKKKQANSIGVLPLNLIRKVNPKYKWKHCLTLLLQSRFSSGAHTSYSQQVL